MTKGSERRTEGKKNRKRADSKPRIEFIRLFSSLPHVQIECFKNSEIVSQEDVVK